MSKPEMSEHEQPMRITASGLEGISATSDDILADDDLYESLIDLDNHRRPASKDKGGAVAPPMMMGGRAGAGPAGGGGAGAAGAAPGTGMGGGTAAAGGLTAPAGPGGIGSPAMGAGVGAPGFNGVSMAGAGVAGASLAGGAAARGPRAGGASGGGGSPAVPMAGMMGMAGMNSGGGAGASYSVAPSAGAMTGGGMPMQGVIAADGTQSFPDYPAGTAGGAGGFPAGGSGSMVADGGVNRFNDAMRSAEDAVRRTREFHAQGAGQGTANGGGGRPAGGTSAGATHGAYDGSHRGGDYSPSHGGGYSGGTYNPGAGNNVVASTTEIRAQANRWAEWADRMREIHARVAQAQSSPSDFGMVAASEYAYTSAHEQLMSATDEAARRFDEFAASLNATADDYTATDQAGVAAVRNNVQI